MQQVERLAGRRPHHHRTGREHDSRRRGEPGEQPVRQQPRAERRGQREKLLIDKKQVP